MGDCYHVLPSNQIDAVACEHLLQTTNRELVARQSRGQRRDAEADQRAA